MLDLQNAIYNLPHSMWNMVIGLDVLTVQLLLHSAIEHRTEVEVTGKLERSKKDYT